MIASTLFERSNFQNKPTTIQHRRYPIPTKVSMKRPSLIVPPSVWKSRLMGGFLSVLFPRRSSFHDSSPHQPRIRYSIAILPLFFTQRFFLYSLRLPPVAKSREYTFVGSSSRVELDHPWPTTLLAQPCHPRSSTAPVRNSISSGAIDRTYPTLRIISLQNCTRGLFFLSLSFSLSPSFQLSGSGSGKEITKIPIFIRSFTSKIQSYLVSLRTVHVRYERSDLW